MRLSEAFILTFDKKAELCFSLPHPPSPPLHFEGVSQSGFDFVAAIFRLRKLLEFNKQFSQTKVCGYKKPNYDTVSLWRGGRGERSFKMSALLTLQVHRAYQKRRTLN
jgi:hypothetical protein